MEENIDNSISSLFDTVKEFLTENSETLNQIEPTTQTSFSNNEDASSLINELEAKPENIENTIQAIDEVMEANDTEAKEDSQKQSISQTTTDPIQQAITDVKEYQDNVTEIKEKELVEEIDAEQQTRTALDSILEDKETELIQDIEEKQEVQSVLDEINEDKNYKQPTTNLTPDLKGNITEEVYKDMEREVIEDYKESQTPLEEDTKNNKIIPQEQNEDIIQASLNITPKTEQVVEKIIEPEIETNKVVKTFQPQTTTLENNINDVELPAIENTEKPFNVLAPSTSNTLSIFDTDTPSKENFEAFANNETQTFFSNPNLNLENSLDEEKLVNLFKSILPQEEQTSYELESELPQDNMYVEAENIQDETSEQILSNTEKTNNTLTQLTQLLTTMIQTGRMQNQDINQSMPVPFPTDTSSPQQGTPDAVLASRDSIIPTIRSKFVYSI